MRALKILALVLLPLVALTACEKKSDAATSYDTSPESNARFLADYAKRPGVTKLPDGLMYRVLKAGSGPQVQKPNDVVTVFYKGALINGHSRGRSTWLPDNAGCGGNEDPLAKTRALSTVSTSSFAHLRFCCLPANMEG